MRCGVVELRIHIPLLHLLPSSFLLLILLQLFLLLPLPLFLLLPPSRICSCSASRSPLLLKVGVKELLAEKDGTLVLLSSSKIYTLNSSLSRTSLELPMFGFLGKNLVFSLCLIHLRLKVQTTDQSPCRQCFDGSQCQC